jgi:hypothetical protein
MNWVSRIYPPVSAKPLRSTSTPREVVWTATVQLELCRPLHQWHGVIANHAGVDECMILSGGSLSGSLPSHG